MHGEYKTPGGKLVVADFAVHREHLADVRISGDFFLYPEEALDAINVALNGASSGSTHAELTALVTDSLPPGTELLGFSPSAVAEAVCRGLAS